MCKIRNRCSPSFLCEYKPVNPLCHVLTGPLDVIDVDWSSLMPKQKQEARAPGAALLRFTPGAVLLKAGISKRLAGPELLEQVREVCKSELDDPKGEGLLDVAEPNAGCFRVIRPSKAVNPVSGRC